MSQTSAELRRAFLEFFRARGHEVVPSAPLVPPNDPTLMFANAGMVQFKDVFTGREQRPYKRATSSQKCIRISGKHNDLENVGPSPRHHTFFEMLGNFSFGDYFKEEAIAFAWEFLTKTVGLPKERLIVTYFKGEEGIPSDDEARDLWRRSPASATIASSALGASDNFWRWATPAPAARAARSTSIHGKQPDLARFGQEHAPDGTGWIEIWNLVFMQFERSTRRAARSSRCRRRASTRAWASSGCPSVLQGKTSTYDTDLLRALVDEAPRISGKRTAARMAPTTSACA